MGLCGEASTLYTAFWSKSSTITDAGFCEDTFVSWVYTQTLLMTISHTHNRHPSCHQIKAVCRCVLISPKNGHQFKFRKSSKYTIAGSVLAKYPSWGCSYEVNFINAPKQCHVNGWLKKKVLLK